MARGSYALRVARGNVVEIEIEKHRIVNRSQLSVVVAERQAVLVHHLRHRQRSLIREVRSVDQVSVAGSADALNAEVDREIELTKLSGDVCEARLPIDVDELMRRTLTEVGSKVAESNVENRCRTDHVCVAEREANVLVERQLVGIRQILRTDLADIRPRDTPKEVVVVGELVIDTGVGLVVLAPAARCIDVV